MGHSLDHVLIRIAASNVKEAQHAKILELHTLILQADGCRSGVQCTIETQVDSMGTAGYESFRAQRAGLVSRHGRIELPMLTTVAFQF